ncbi:hypothetical protein G9P44_004354 [Scheffersomyces stipitis]|nr:hypothetical protein G9P44_004354 [Scheffersomyces stipitis]
MQMQPAKIRPELISLISYKKHIHSRDTRPDFMNDDKISRRDDSCLSFTALFSTHLDLAVLTNLASNSDIALVDLDTNTESLSVAKDAFASNRDSLDDILDDFDRDTQTELNSNSARDYTSSIHSNVSSSSIHSDTSTMTNHQATADDSAPFVYDPVVFKFSKLVIKYSQLKYVTFTIIGIALLWPWNAFLSASAYYAERFGHSPGLVKIYSSTMMSVSCITSTCFNYYLSQAQSGVNYTFRVNAGFWVTIAVFIFMGISCVSDLFIHMWDTTFFTLLMFMVFTSALATCLAQNGTMAIVNVLGSIYANAVMVGQAVAGVLPSCALIISILLVGEKKGSATDDDYVVEKNYGVFIYYITASLIAALSILLLFWTDHYRTVTDYEALNQIAGEEQPLSAASEPELVPVMTQEKFVPFSVLWSKLKYIVSTIFLTFSITLIFPVFASTIESTHTDSKNKFFKKEIYIPFIYLVWNLGDLFGRILCGFPRLHMLITNPKVLLWYSISRLIFIPLFFTCNIHPFTAANQSSAFINSDLWYIFLQLIFGISNGQLCTSCFMIVGDHCDNDDEKEAAGGFTTVFLSVGLAVGAVLSYLLVLAIQ